MWHSVIPVKSGYDPVLCESDEPKTVLILNAGPDNVEINVWDGKSDFMLPAKRTKELLAGNQFIVEGSLVRAKIKPNGSFAALGVSIIHPLERERPFP